MGRALFRAQGLECGLDTSGVNLWYFSPVWLLRRRAGGMSVERSQGSVWCLKQQYMLAECQFPSKEVELMVSVS